MTDHHLSEGRVDVYNILWRNSTDTWYSSLSESEKSMSDEKEVIFELDEEAMAELPPHLQKHMRDIQRERFKRLSKENPDLKVRKRKRHVSVQQTVGYHNHYTPIPQLLAERSNLEVYAEGYMDPIVRARTQSTTAIPSISGHAESCYSHGAMVRQDHRMHSLFPGEHKRIRGTSVGEYRKTPIGLEPRAYQVRSDLSGNERSPYLPFIFHSGAERRPPRRQNTQGSSLFRGNTSFVSSVRGHVRKSLQRLSGVFQRN